MTSPYREPAERVYYAPDFDTEAVKQLRKLPRSRVMRGVVGGSYGLLAVAMVMAGTAMTEGCSAFTAQNVQTVLDVAKVACIIANAESSEAVVKDVCGVLAAEEPALKTILGEQRKASRRFASFSASSATCAQCDGGTCAEAGTK